MIGEKIKALRERAGWTQSELARKLGLSRSAINAWEMGLSIPSTQYIVDLANLFKVTSDSLLCLDASVIVNISDLKEEEQAVIIQLIHLFTNKTQ